MADNKETNQPQRMSAAAGAQEQQSGTQRQGDVKSQRGGPQENQLSGETDRGAHNQEMKNRNPQGDKPDQNQSARQKGNTL